MNKLEINKLARINATRATRNLNKLYQTKDAILFGIMESARDRWFRSKMRMFY